MGIIDNYAAHQGPAQDTMPTGIQAPQALLWATLAYNRIQSHTMEINLATM